MFLPISFILQNKKLSPREEAMRAGMRKPSGKCQRDFSQMQTEHTKQA